MSFISKIVQAVTKIPFVKTFINRLVTNRLATSTSSRPHSHSLWSPKDKLGVAPSSYLTWHTITDKEYFDLHLPPADDNYINSLPSNQPTKEHPFGEITALFERNADIKKSRSTVLFMFFAQWFTDGFFRSSHIDPRKTTSNHNIDLAQIYGYNEQTAIALRSGISGKLQTKIINGEEYPDYLGSLDSNGNWHVKDKYKQLPYIVDKEWMEDIFGGLTDTEKSKLFASGLERGNSIVGHMTISTLFIREHNSICDLLSRTYPGWDDDRLFHTARIINTVILMKIVVEEYVNHIAGLGVLKFDPTFAQTQSWYRAPWISAEFNLLYRWHGLVPNSLSMDGAEHSLVKNYEVLINHGLSKLLKASANQAAGEISLRNVPKFLMPAEQKMITKGREWRLQSFNKYRKQFGLSKLTSFHQLSSDTTLNNELERLYGHIDNLELTVGLFAEQGTRTLTGELQTTMVAYDAITQIYTNPLLTSKNYNQQNFTEVGLKRINETTSLQDLARRNADKDISISFNV